MKETNINDYVQVKPPIKPMITEVVNAMKGADRSMAVFAHSTGISTAMLSRIVNGNYSKPISVDILQRIASCSIDGCPVDLEDLLKANGMVPREVASRMSIAERRHQKALEQIRRRREMREIVLDELFAREIAIKKIGSLGEADSTYSELFRGVRTCDLAIRLPDRDNMEWGFSMLSAVKEGGDTESNETSYINRIIEYYAIIFLEDAWKPENTKSIKFTFGFADNYFYNRFIDALKIAKFNNRISALLINVKAKKVIEEYNFPCSNYDDIEKVFDLPTHHEKEVEREDYRQLSFFDNEDSFLK
ncbi:MAG: helix-turn-helix transcriptional regulator [Lachnospiraceae bacterium]|nr:helix-turn-helix transcriptional regulator [Lachnospiraceae bacterium]